MIYAHIQPKMPLQDQFFSKTLIYIEHPIGNIHTATATATASTPD